MLCTKIVLNVKTKQKQQFVYTTCSAGILTLQFSWTMINLSSYCGLVDAKRRASDKELPVITLIWLSNNLIEKCINIKNQRFNEKNISAVFFCFFLSAIKMHGEKLLNLKRYFQFGRILSQKNPKLYDVRYGLTLTTVEPLRVTKIDNQCTIGWNQLWRRAILL